MKAPLYANVRCPDCGCVMNRTLLRHEVTNHWDEWIVCLSPGCDHYKKRWLIPMIELEPFKEIAGVDGR